MSDKKRSKRRKDEYTGPGGAEVEIEKPSKDEYSVAKWIKKNVPTKKTKFLNHHVEYFTATKALDALMASKFAQGDQCLFPTREIAIDFLDAMLTHKFFHRAKKVPVSEAELRRGKKPIEKDNKSDEEKTVKKRQTVEKSKDDKASADDTETGTNAESTKLDKAPAEKKKRKIRLDMHPDQVFVDGGEAYVWIYDPIPMHYWLFGALVVVGAIVVCLFPLWPPMIRKGVYYLSIAAAGFLVFILGLAALRFIVFCIVWVLTGSKHHLWIFPNLTEDVGFFASFWPLYTHDYRDGSSDKSKKKKNKKDKDSDAEDDSNVTLLEPEKIENIKENETGTIVSSSVDALLSNDDGIDDDQSEKQNDHNSKNSSEVERDSDSESSHRSTDKDFEIVNTDDVDTS
ncbi:translocation protein SEC62 isoform X2 [Contarinia nasturtii]|uniref:translocation protein SEC62 isoform X2 n=1 Tax=Contarinia nasturtii TaxID=265458 RepID=UPI0012D43565|nr:translocation protein SEC62 isoform X2 [Contarinia nasturtii]